MATEYPEHEKLKAVQDKSQAIGSFLDWLTTEYGVVLARRHDHVDGCYDSDSGECLCGVSDNDLLMVNEPIRTILAKYFDIDEAKLENEKQAMIEELRRSHEQGRNKKG